MFATYLASDVRAWSNESIRGKIAVVLNRSVEKRKNEGLGESHK